MKKEPSAERASEAVVGGGGVGWGGRGCRDRRRSFLLKPQRGKKSSQRGEKGGAVQRTLQKLNKTKQNKNKQEVLCNVFFLGGDNLNVGSIVFCFAKTTAEYSGFIQTRGCDA